MKVFWGEKEFFLYIVEGQNKKIFRNETIFE